MEMKWLLREDGSFDLLAGPLSLLNCYPAFDYRPIHPCGLECKPGESGGEIIYRLADGKITLFFGADKDQLILSAVWEGQGNAPHWIFPMAQAAVSGADRLFKQGLGFGGPSGIKILSEMEGAWTLESYAVAALLAPSGATLAAGAFEHRDFLQRTTIYNRRHRWGLVDRHAVCAEVFWEAGFSTEKIKPAAGILVLPSLRFISGSKPFETLQRFAAELGRAAGVELRQPPAYHWCSWYERAKYFTMDDLRDVLSGLKRLDPPVPLQTIQIDDGYCTAGDWLHSNERWPEGMAAVFSEIRAAGFRAGIWVAPFMVGNRSRLYQEHPGWVLHTPDGKPLAEWRNYDGAENEETYVLDTSHPEAFAYLRNVFRTFRSWGAAYYKTDFMDWGLRDSTAVRRFTPGKTSVQYFMDVVRMVREEIGPDSFWLACIAPFAPLIGFADAVRIGNDVGCEWSVGGLGNMLEESVADQYFNNIWWQNDPDVLYLRDYFTRLTEEETRSLAFWNGMLGGVVNTSDRLHRIPPDRLKLFRFLEPGVRPRCALFPNWDKPGKLLAAVRPYPGDKSWAVLFLNPHAEPATEKRRLGDLIGAEEAFCFQWEPGRSHALGRTAYLVPELPGHACALFYLSLENEAPAGDMGLSGSRMAGLGEIK